MLKVATVERMRAFGIAACIVLAAGSLAAQQAAPGPRELYQALNDLRVVPRQVYYVRDLHISRDAVRLSLVEGKLALLADYDGRLTGAVFTGHGHVLALSRDPIEKRSLARFLGAPLLDQSFSRAYFRFTDKTGEELLGLLRQAGVQPADEPSFAEDWNPVVANLNPWHSLRILMDWSAADPQPYFYAGLQGDISGPFDVLVDDRRAEQVLLGQPRWVAGTRLYDVWASFRRTGAAANEPSRSSFRVSSPCSRPKTPRGTRWCSSRTRRSIATRSHSAAMTRCWWSCRPRPAPAPSSACASPTAAA